MNVEIIYDTGFGNTKEIAEAIGKAIDETATVLIASVDAAHEGSLKKQDLLLFGSPTYGGRPTEKMQKFLDTIPPESLNNLAYACFDTRFRENDQNFALKLLMKTIGYAAPKIDAQLKSKGARSVMSPEGFIVKGKTGPIANGEVARAENWGRDVVSKITTHQ